MLLAAIEKKFPPAAHVRLLGNLCRVTETMTVRCAARALRNVPGSRGLLNSHAAIETDPVMIIDGHVKADYMINIETVQPKPVAVKGAGAFGALAERKMAPKRGPTAA